MLSRFFLSIKPMLARIGSPSLALSIAAVLLGAFSFHLIVNHVPVQSAMGEESKPNFTAVLQPRPAAPELDGGIDWLNTDKPIKLADLKGRIVVLDFWTLCCINCIHIMPDLAKLEARYPGVLVVIGVHTPKFDNEKKTASIFKAVLRYELKHPVVNDADHKIWNAYGVRSWPTLGLIDPDGKVVRGFSGEGNYEVLDREIQKLIKEFALKGTLKKTPIEFKLIKEKFDNPIYFPGKVLADAESKRIFIADSTNHRIVITNLDGKKIAIAGSGTEGFKDGKFADARFSDPQGMCLDGETLYVADRKNHSIRALDLKAGTVKIVAGIGTQGKSRVGGLALKTGLNSPWDLLLHRVPAADPNKTAKKLIFIAMAGHHQIWVFDPAREVISPYAGNGNEEITDGPLLGVYPQGSAFAQPSGLASDGKHLFVADSEVSAIRSVTLPGAARPGVTTVVGEGLFEFGDKNGKGKEVRLQHALGVAYLDSKLYVADTYNRKIKLIDPDLRTCETYLGDPPGWLKEKMFDEPGGLSISGGKMYVADTNNHRIQVVDMKTKEMTTLRLQDVEPVRRGVAMSKDAK
jgi:thiol-disulfide isomerase/thioredoxin